MNLALSALPVLLAGPAHSDEPQSSLFTEETCSVDGQRNPLTDPKNI